MWYAAFGLTVESELEFPEFQPIDAPVGGDADVRIRFGPVDDDSGPGNGSLRQTDDGDVLSFPDCRMLVRDGCEIVVDVQDSATPAGVRWSLLGAGVNFLLFQRGALVIHASVVGIDGHGVAFVGRSGKGKSTTAAAFLAAGYDLLSDDVAAIRIVDDGERTGSPGVSAGTAEVIPGFSAMKLSEPAIEALDLTVEQAGESPIAAKRYYRPAGLVAASERTDPLPLAAVYFLEEGDTVATEPLPTGAAIVELMRESHTIATHSEAGPAGSALAAAGAVAGRVPVCRLTRPLTFDSLPVVVDRVVTDVIRAAGDPGADTDRDPDVDVGTGIDVTVPPADSAGVWGP
jgi:hypothetical protein